MGEALQVFGGGYSGHTISLGEQRDSRVDAPEFPPCHRQSRLTVAMVSRVTRPCCRTHAPETRRSPADACASAIRIRAPCGTPGGEAACLHAPESRTRAP